MDEAQIYAFSVKKSYNHRAEGIFRQIEGIRDVLDCRAELERKYKIIINVCLNTAA